jgi:O-antigen ligase
MSQTITIFVLIAGAVLAGLAATIGMAGAVHVTSRRAQGYFHLIFYAIVLAVALGTFLGGRDLAVLALNLAEPPAAARPALLNIAQPLLSLLVLTVAGERIITHWLKRDKAAPTPHFLLLVFVIFWAGTVAAPALFGAHPQLSHDFVYPVIIGTAAILATRLERDRAIAATRNALFLLMLGGMLLAFFKPNMALDATYNQGLLPGVPRFAGLAPHAVAMGLLAQLALLCLMTLPYQKVWVNRLAWVVGLSVLFLAQSKTGWIAFALCSACVLVMRNGADFWRRTSDPLHPEFGIVVVSGFIVALLAAGGLMMFGGIGAKVAGFFDSAQGAQLTSLTGRDQIWAIAYDEWQRNPVFGYGPSLWDASFRASIGMPNATHAHNQFMDTLSRSGTVGATALVLYAATLLVMSVWHARATGGLSLALFVALALRSVSEVPLLLFGYGPELITQVLLLMTLVSATAKSTARAKRTPPPPLAQRSPFAPGVASARQTDQHLATRSGS